MTSANRPNRKASDEDLIRLNSVGLSLATVGEILKCHPSTVTLRLRDLGVEPADTRRAFMEEIYFSLTLSQQEWLADQLGPSLSIKDFVKHLLVKEFVASKGGAPISA
jgi:hypothetical protein